MIITATETNPNGEVAYTKEHKLRCMATADYEIKGMLIFYSRHALEHFEWEMDMFDMYPKLKTEDDKFIDKMNKAFNKSKKK